MSNSLEQQMAAFMGEMTVILDAVKQIPLILDGINELKQRMDSLEQRMDSLEQRMDSLEQRMDSLEQRMDSLEHKVDSLEHKVDSLEHKVDRIQKQTAENAELHSVVGKLQEQVDEHESTIGAVHLVLDRRQKAV